MNFLYIFLIFFSFSTAILKADTFPPADFYYTDKLPDICKYYKNYESEDKMVNFDLASIYKEFGENEEAEKIYKKILQKDDKETRAHFELAKVYYFLGKYNEAENEINYIINTNIINWEIYFWWGCILLKEKKYDDALEKFENALKLDTRKVVIYIKMASTFIEKGQIDEAIKYYKMAIQADKTYTELNRKIAKLYEKKNDFLNAYRYWVVLNNIDPKDEEVLKKVNYYIENIQGLKDKAVEYEKEIQKKRDVFIPPDKKTIVDSEHIPVIRVGIIKNADSISFKCGGDFEVLDSKGRYLYNGEKLKEYNVSFNEGKPYIGTNGEKNYFKEKIFIIKKNKDTTTSIYNIIHGEGFYWSEKKDTPYRGDFLFIADKNNITLVNLINVEEYLYGVVPSEIPSHWDKEAIKAQAVAARTYTLKHLNQHAKEGFDLCATQHCAVYKGILGESKKVNEAIDETRAEILVNKNGKPIDTFYSHCCGGHTQDVSDIWGFDKIKNLAGVYDGKKNSWEFPLSPFWLEEWVRFLPDVYCKVTGDNETSFRWIRYFDEEDLNYYINKKNDIGKIKAIIPLKRAKYGALTELKVIGQKNSKKFKFDALRNLLGKIRSNVIKWEYSKNADGFIDEIFIYGAGWGHGVGMCQRGVKGMAEKGFNYKEILLHYFPETEIIKKY